MNIAILPRWRRGTLEKIWAGHSFSVANDFVSIANRYGIGLTCILTRFDVEHAAENCDGLIIPGGCSMGDPYEGGEEFDPPDLFALDDKVIDAFVRQGKPIFGICRGNQTINRFFGGTIYEFPNKPEHYFYNDPTPFDRYGNQIKHRIHHVNVEEGSFVHDAYGETRIITNSYHSFAVDQLAPCLTVVARTDDGVVEAIENKEMHIYGTQWHPELGYRMNEPLDMKLFENFFETCRKVAQEREG